MLESHGYDSQRRGTSSQLANGVNAVSARYTAGLTYVTDSQNNTTNVSFAILGQRAYPYAIQGPGCSSCGWHSSSFLSVNSNGYPNVIADANNHLYSANPTYTYDSTGNVLMKTLPEGDPTTNQTGVDVWQYTYNNFGEVLTATDPLNHTTTYQYDTHGNLKSITTPSPDGGTTPGSVTQFAYYANGTLNTITDPLSHVTTFTYYTNGLLNTLKDANGKIWTYVYDGRGNLTSIQDPANGSTKLTTFTYDPMNRIKTITYPGATASITYHYDYRGRRDYVIDQNNFKTSYGYDDADRLTSVTDAQSPTAGVTTYGYDSESNLTDIYDAKQNHTQFQVVTGNVLKTTFPSTLTETYGYDNNNNPHTKTDRNGNNFTYTYDFQNRLDSVHTPEQTITYTYDPAGRLTQVTDASGTYGFVYDNMDRLTEADTNYAFLGIGNQAVKYGYDKASNRNSMTDPQSVATTYGYDVLNRLSSLTYNGQTPNYTFGYDPLSRRNSLTRPNGIATSYGYDSMSDLLSVLHKQGTTVIDGASYTYDQAGNRKTRTDKRTNVTLTYGYDNIYQLLSAKQGTTTKESYTYDLVGNRLSSLGVSPYNYNSSNELTSTPSGSYTYDNNGNRKTDPSGAQYSWDSQNRLTQVVLPGAGGTVNFKYDAFGRRAQKSFTQGSTTTTTNYIYDAANILATVNSSGAVLARYVETNGIDEPMEEVVSGTTSYYEQDGLGSVSSLSNSAGSLANTYTYDSYGKLTASSGTVANPFQYTGREFDTETGLYYYRGRYYDQGLGRFLSEDPIAFASDDFNFYSYGGNDPVDWVDPSGYSRDTYVPDPSHHGGPHIDRYNPAGQNVGRYSPDGTPLKHKGKPSPPIPNSDEEKFKRAADKLNKTPNACEQPKKIDDSSPFCAPGERFDCIPRPGSYSSSPWWWPADPLVPRMPTVPVWPAEPLPVPVF